jgi:hypothetical protein
MSVTSGAKSDEIMRWCWEPAPRTTVIPIDGRAFRLRFSEEGYPEIVCSMRSMIMVRNSRDMLMAAFWYVRDRFMGGPQGLDRVLWWDPPDERARIIQLRPKIAAEVEADDAEDSESA